MVVVHNRYFAKAGLAETVYHWRLHANDVRALLGFPRGQVLRRISETASQPDVIWQCEYPNMTSRQQEADAISATPEFQAVMAHMQTLLARFEREIWLISTSS